jgi:hypothetical protein
MFEKIYARLLRLYPSSFRKKYEGEALQLIQDRLRDEKGFFKRARLWWDLVVDVLAGLPSAYGNSYAVTESASLSFNAASIPSFKILDDGRLGPGSILAGGTIALIVLAAFAFLLSRPIGYRPLSGSNGRLSPIEAVMQRLNQAPAVSSLPDNLANGPTADVQNGSHDSQTVIAQLPRHSGMVAKLTPTVALSYLPANLAPGSMVNLTARVLAVDAGPTPTGNVRFFDGSTVLNMGNLNNGTVTVKGKLPYIARHSLSAIYYGDANYSSANSIGERERSHSRQ